MPEGITRALVVAPAWIGDTVMAHPLFMRLHRRIPGLQLDALAPPWVAPVLRRMPEIGEIIDNPFAHGELSFQARYRLARQLAQCGYRQAYVLPNSLKSALIPFLACIPERIGFTGESRYGLINRRHVLDKVALPQMAERFAQLAQTPGSPLERPVEYPRLTSSPAQQAETLEKLGIERPQRVAVFCPGAEYGPAKRWPAAHFARLAQDALARGWQAWVFGSGKDQAIADEIVRLAGAPTGLVNLCGRTGLDQAIDLMSLAGAGGALYPQPPRRRAD